MASPTSRSNPDGLIREGVARLQAGAPAEAVKPFRRAIIAAPQSPEAHAYLGTALLMSGSFAEAIPALRRALSLSPDFTEAHYNLGLALERSGDSAGAEVAWRRALAINPFYLKPWNNLGLLLEARGDAAAARVTFEDGLKHAPPDGAGSGELWNNLGNLHEQAGEADAGLAAYERAVALRPQDARLHLNLGTLLVGVGKVEPALVELAKARELAPDSADAAHAYFLARLHRDEDPAAGLAAAKDWAATLTAPVPAPYDNARDPARRLRVGYVSPDFYCHAVASFIEPVLATHDRKAVEVFCYANVRYPDDVTARLRGRAEHWHDVRALDDQQLAARIRADRIDILIDLAGHTIGSRLAAFARRPAPVQLSWIGYPATTGMTQVDARIVDALTDPPGLTDAHNSEKLLRLTGGFNCYAAPAEAPAVGPLPALANGYVTFGSFNHAAKITPEAVQLWAALLRIVPTARFLIKHRGFALKSVRDDYHAAFTARGTDVSRLELVPPIKDIGGHLAAYHRVDIALDSFPYNGTTTTCEALWMGVPVVTLGGATHRARVGASLLTRAGFLGFVASTPRDYVGLAERLAGDLPRLAELRTSLRADFAASPVCDAVALTRHLEDTFRDLWRGWCAAS